MKPEPVSLSSCRQVTPAVASQPTLARNVLAIALAMVVMLFWTTPAGARPAEHPGVVLTFDPGGMTLSRDMVRAGQVTFTLKAPDVDVASAVMFRLRGSSTLADLRLDWEHALSDDLSLAAQGTRDLSRHAVFFGLAEVSKGRPLSVTQLVTPGVYFLQDSPFAVEGTRHMLRLHVSGQEAAGTSRAAAAPAVIAFTSDDRFDIEGRLPAVGTVTLRNRSGSIQSMGVWPVRPGTTDAEVQAWLDAGAEGDPGFFLDGPTTGFVLMSPGRTAQLSWNLPAGSYLLLCEVRDDRTGINRIFEGMHQVVVLH